MVRSRLMDHFHLDDGVVGLSASKGSARADVVRSVDDLDQYRRTEKLIQGTPFVNRDKPVVSPDLRGFRLQHLFNATQANFNLARSRDRDEDTGGSAVSPSIGHCGSDTLSVPSLPQQRMLSLLSREDGEDLGRRVEELQQRRLRMNTEDAVSFICLPRT